MMRKRPNKEILSKQFIDKSPSNTEDRNIVQHKTVDNLKLRFWPMDELIPTPELKEGSNLTKSMSLPLKEFEWNTIDYHVKHLGLKKAEWVRHAIYKLLESEQKLLNSNDKKTEQ